MGKVKNQHYVPRSYLRYFANKKEQVWVYDKESDNSYQTNITNVASQRYFYDLRMNELQEIMSEEDNNKIREIFKEINVTSDEEINTKLEQSVEKFFSEKIEGPFKNHLDKIRCRYTLSPSPTEAIALTDEERYQLSILLAYQIVRSKEFRQTQKESTNAATQALVDIIAKSMDENYELGTIKLKRQYEFDELEHAKMILSEFPFELAEILFSHTWMVGMNLTNLPFYTSDQPIVKRAHKEEKFFSTNGYASEGIEIAFPISRNLILIILEKTYHHELAPYHQRFFPMYDEQNVVYYNSLQVYQSNRQVFCPIEDFQLIKKMRKSEGSLARKKQQMIVNSFLGERIY